MVLARSNRQRAIKYYAEALQSDVSDIQHSTTAEGAHLGAMAGTVDLGQRVCTGIEITGDVVRFNPHLPEALGRLDMRIRYRGHTAERAGDPRGYGTAARPGTRRRAAATRSRSCASLTR